MKVILLTIFVFFAALGQTGEGKKYDTRDPFVCKSKKDPASGAPSASQVKDYVRCNAISGEGIAGGYIGLYENMQMEVGKSRPFSGWADAGSRGIDNAMPVYPVAAPSIAIRAGLPERWGFQPAGIVSCGKRSSLTARALRRRSAT